HHQRKIAVETFRPLTSTTSLNIMPLKEDLNQIIKSIQLMEIQIGIISRIEINVLVKYQTQRSESMPGGVKV
ncbi:hypothetical protein V7P28_40930, partial [Klebsiella michiganensis]